MENGLALLDENGKRNKNEEWIIANEKGLDKNPDLINVIQEQEEYWINYLKDYLKKPLIILMKN